MARCKDCRAASIWPSFSCATQAGPAIGELGVAVSHQPPAWRSGHAHPWCSAHRSALAAKSASQGNARAPGAANRLARQTDPAFQQLRQQLPGGFVFGANSSVCASSALAWASSPSWLSTMARLVRICAWWRPAWLPESSAGARPAPVGHSGWPPCPADSRIWLTRAIATRFAAPVARSVPARRIPGGFGRRQLSNGEKGRRGGHAGGPLQGKTSTLAASVRMTTGRVNTRSDSSGKR